MLHSFEDGEETRYRESNIKAFTSTLHRRNDFVFCYIFGRTSAFFMFFIWHLKFIAVRDKRFLKIVFQAFSCGWFIACCSVLFGQKLCSSAARPALVQPQNCGKSCSQRLCKWKTSLCGQKPPKRKRRK